MPRGAPGRVCRTAGFTLIELMVVLVLIGGAFTYGLVNIDNLLPRTRLDKAARDVGQLLTRLRGMAIFAGTPHYMEYDLDAQRYRMLRPATEAEEDDGADEFVASDWFELPKKVRIKSVQFSERNTENRGFVRVEFTPSGEVSGHLVHVQSDDIIDDSQSRFTVELNPITGLVSYIPGTHKEYNQVRNEFEFR